MTSSSTYNLMNDIKRSFAETSARLSDLESTNSALRSELSEIKKLLQNSLSRPVQDFTHHSSATNLQAGTTIEGDNHGKKRDITDVLMKGANDLKKSKKKKANNASLFADDDIMNVSISSFLMKVTTLKIKESEFDKIELNVSCKDTKRKKLCRVKKVYRAAIAAAESEMEKNMLRLKLVCPEDKKQQWLQNLKIICETVQKRLMKTYDCEKSRIGSICSKMEIKEKMDNKRTKKK